MWLWIDSQDLLMADSMYSKLIILLKARTKTICVLWAMHNEAHIQWEWLGEEESFFVRGNAFFFKNFKAYFMHSAVTSSQYMTSCIWLFTSSFFTFLVLLFFVHLIVWWWSMVICIRWKLSKRRTTPNHRVQPITTNLTSYFFLSRFQY